MTLVSLGLICSCGYIIGRHILLHHTSFTSHTEKFTSHTEIAKSAVCYHSYHSCYQSCSCVGVLVPPRAALLSVGGSVSSSCTGGQSPSIPQQWSRVRSVTFFRAATLRICEYICELFLILFVHKLVTCWQLTMISNGVLAYIKAFRQELILSPFGIMFWANTSLL